MTRLLLAFFLSISFLVLPAQTFLQLEKSGSLKTERFYEGQILLFQLENDDNWYEETIEKIYVEDGIVHFTHRIISVDKITTIRDYNRFRFFKGLGNKLVIFAGGYLGLSLLATLADWPLTIDTAIIGGSAITLGLLLKWIFKKKTWRIKGKRRLRALSLDFGKTPPV